LKGAHKNKIAAIVLETLASSLFAVGDTALDAAVPTQKNIRSDGTFNDRFTFTVFDAGHAIHTVIVD